MYGAQNIATEATNTAATSVRDISKCLTMSLSQSMMLKSVCAGYVLNSLACADFCSGPVE